MGVIIALILIWYFFIRKPDVSQIAATQVTPGVTGPVITPAPGNVIAAPVNPVTALGQSQTLDTTPNIAQGAPNTTFDAIIYPWFNSLSMGNKTQAYAMYPQMSQAEKSALAHLIQIGFGQISPKAADGSDDLFWNTWRQKYGILDGTH
jgi:hypothetical protein